MIGPMLPDNVLPMPCHSGVTVKRMTQADGEDPGSRAEGRAEKHDGSGGVLLDGSFPFH